MLVNKKGVLKERRVLIETPIKGSKNLLLEIEGGNMALEKAKRDPDQPIFLVGVIQKGDTPNRNGRIYPFSILKKECERYTKEEIRDGQSFGELDHPCLDNQHSILTKNGWISIVDVKVGDIVATRNPDTGDLEYKPVLKKIDEPYYGKMYKLYNEHFSSVVTPNHKFFTQQGKGFKKGKFLVFDQFNSNTQIPQFCNWKGEDLKTITVKGTKLLPEVEISTEVLMKFLGWFISEGWVRTDSNGFKFVQISQTKQNGKDDIVNILNQMPFNWREKIQKDNKESTFTINSTALGLFCEQFGKGAFNKCIPQFIKDLDKKYLEILIEYLYKGDGHKNDYYSVSKQLIDDVGELLLKTGYSFSIKEKKVYKKDYLLKNKKTEEIELVNNITYYSKEPYRSNKENYEVLEKQKILKENKSYTIRKKISKYCNARAIKKEEFLFDDRIYCIEVENHTFLTMRDGKVTWTGNSESTVPELKNAAMTIEDIWFKGVEVWGKIKLLNAFASPGDPALKARNIILNEKTLGISSRALGSVYQDGSGYDVVEDDLEVICWDLVSRPSTYEANLKLIESKSKNNKNLVLTERQCLGGNCNLKTSKEIIKEKKLQGLTEAEKIYLNILGVEKFLKIKKQTL